MAEVDTKASSRHVESTGKPLDVVDESFEGLTPEEERALEKRRKTIRWFHTTGVIVRC